MDELEKLKAKNDQEERKIRDDIGRELKTLEEQTQKDIEREKIHMENCLEVEIGKLKEEVEHKIEEINKNRYANLPKFEGGNDGEVAHLKEKIEVEIAKDKEEFERAARERRRRFDAQMEVVLAETNQQRIGFLKQAHIPLVNTPEMTFIADESILELRYRLKITRNAICSGSSYALYKSRFRELSTVTRITVLYKIPNEIRSRLKESSRCFRFLCEEPKNEHFIKLYQIFVSEQKLYVVMEECNKDNMHAQVYRNKPASSELKKWYSQICDALNFMHNYAIGHLNIRLDSIVFTPNNDVKIVGFCRAFCYFNLDQEKFLKVPKLQSGLMYNDHMPPECFEEDFLAEKADVWSFGALIYESETRLNPRKEKADRVQKGRAPDYRNPLFYFEKISDESLVELVQKMVVQVVGARPSFKALMKNFS